MGLLYLCLLIGFSAWWVFLPEQIILLPLASLDADFVTIVKETFVEKVCSYQDVGDRCMCEDRIHKIAAEMFTKMEHALARSETFDPLGFSDSYSNKKLLAVMIGALIVSLALNESVAQGGVLI